MRSSQYKRLGDYIEPHCEKNVGLTVKLSQGINNNKYFQNPRQVAQNSENDQIVRKGQFAFNKATTRNGDKISIAYRDGEDCTVSSAYQVFSIKDEEKLNPYYLLLWFKRPEFDRYARFKSHGSAHEFFTWEEMCNVLLPVPPITEQRRIVNEYQTVERRIANNEALIQKLEETAQAIYHHTFVEGIDEEKLPEGWRIGKLGDIASFSNGKVLSPKGGSLPVYGGNGIVGYTDIENANDVIVIGRVGVNCGCLYFNRGKCWINDNAIKAYSKNKNNVYLFFLLKDKQLNSLSEGSGQPLLTQTILNGIPCLIPSQAIIEEFDNKASILVEYIELLSQETHHLRTLLTLLTSKLS